MLRLILSILLLNGVISFGYAIFLADDPTALWAAFAVNFTFYLGITQSGIVFSAIMRFAKSEWGRHFSRLGEILTLSSIPVAFIAFLVLYFGGADDLFYWTRPEPQDDYSGHMSPWLGKGLFFWRNIATMTLFYLLSYLYFKNCRIEEEMPDVPVRLEKWLNMLAGLVTLSYVIANTNMAWDFGMMIIRHWESTIFPPYYWVGNIFAGSAFLFLISSMFLPRTSPGADKGRFDSVGKLLLGFTILWTYLLWSQHIVIWYSDFPHLTGPLFKTMTWKYSLPFTLMILAAFILPFFALMFRFIKFSRLALSLVSVAICAGIWINRYLMITPAVTTGDEAVFASWTGLALVLAGLSATLLSIKAFIKLFPQVSLISNAGSTDAH